MTKNLFDFNYKLIKPEIFEFHKSDISIFIQPIIHNSVVQSQLTSIAISELLPDIVVLDLPEELEILFNKSIENLPNFSIIMHETDVDGNQIVRHNKFPYFLVTPSEPIFWAGKEALKQGIRIQAIDKLILDAKPSIDLPIGSVEQSISGWKTIFSNSLEKVRAHIEHPIHNFRSFNFSSTLNEIADKGKFNKIYFVCGAAHLLPIMIHLKEFGFICTDNEMNDTAENLTIKEPIFVKNETNFSNWKVYPLNHKHLYHYLTDLPYIIQNFAFDPIHFDYYDTIRNLFTETGRKYMDKFDDLVPINSYLKMLQYLRNLSYLKKNLIPQLIDMIYSAKGMVDDDYAYELFKIATLTKNKDQTKDIEISFPPPQNTHNFIKLTFKRRFRKSLFKENDSEDFMDEIPSENYSGEWKDVWDEFSQFGYVSYPPEDEFIEAYLNKIRNKINRMLAEESSSTMKFESSLEDGIDYRETARRFHEGTIYVKKIPKVKAQIGALIIQFLEEPVAKIYGHHSTLFAEHEEESHLSTITTAPGKEFVGPGICRVKYAALVSQFPPDGYPTLISKTNDDLKLRLVATAMKMSLSKIIGFVSPKPPHHAIKSFASSYGFRLVYIPMDNLSKLSLHRLRTMHLLAHRDLRDIAKEYIGF